MDNASTQAMPLRIALLVDPVEVMSDRLRAASSLPSITQVLVNNDFEAALQRAVDLVNQGEMVQLSIASDSVQGEAAVFMLSGLAAAKNKIHPHAYLSGFSVECETIQRETCLKQALQQAKRQHIDLSHQVALNALTAQKKYQALKEKVSMIASRTRHLDDGTEQYWFTEPNKGRVTSITFGNEACTSSLVLTQATGLKVARSLLSPSRLFFIIRGADSHKLSSALERLAGCLNETSSPRRLLSVMTDNLRQFQVDVAEQPSMPTIVLQGTSVEVVLQEISAVNNALTATMDTKGHYKTPMGSCFSASPNSHGGVTFVYPGVGTVYSGMLVDFHHYFPDLFARLEREGNLKEILQADKIYGCRENTMSLSELAIAGVGSSYLLTQLLCNEFAIKPDFALGYSKGEASMWASLGVWKNPHALIEMTKTSPIFTSAISGELTAVREAWGLTDDEEIIWNSFVVRCDPQTIESLLPDFPHAYLAIIQGDTCVIAGCETSCRDLLKKLGKRGIAANRVTAMHTEPAMSQHKQVTEFYTQPLCDELPKHIRFISAAGLLSHNQDLPIQMNCQSIANSIADTYCSKLDFTALIRSARTQGARLFIEVGADRQTCTLIDKINRADNVINDHVTVATNAKGGEDISTLLKCLAQLVSHQIPLSLNPLIEGLEQYQYSSEKTLEGEPV